MDDRTVLEICDNLAKQDPDALIYLRTLNTFPDNALTYQKLIEEVNALAVYFADQFSAGGTEQKRLALLLEMDLNMVLASLASWQLGLTPVLIHPRGSTEDTLKACQKFSISACVWPQNNGDTVCLKDRLQVACLDGFASSARLKTPQDNRPDSAPAYLFIDQERDAGLSSIEIAQQELAIMINEPKKYLELSKYKMSTGLHCFLKGLILNLWYPLLVDKGVNHPLP